MERQALDTRVATEALPAEEPALVEAGVVTRVEVRAGLDESAGLEADDAIAHVIDRAVGLDPGVEDEGPLAVGAFHPRAVEAELTDGLARRIDAPLVVPGNSLDQARMPGSLLLIFDGSRPRGMYALVSSWKTPEYALLAPVFVTRYVGPF